MSSANNTIEVIDDKGLENVPQSAKEQLQFGADLELHFRTMIGTGTNPNVAAVIVIGIEPVDKQNAIEMIGLMLNCSRQKF